VDEAGYLRSDLDDLADKLGAPAGLIDQGSGVLQGFDSARVFARDLAECLALQLRSEPLRSADRHRCSAPGTARRPQPRALKRAVGVDAEELADMIRGDQAASTPNRAYGSARCRSSSAARLMVRPARDGSWLVELNNDTLPRVLVIAATTPRSASARTPSRIAAICSIACRAPIAGQ